MNCFRLISCGLKPLEFSFASKSLGIPLFAWLFCERLPLQFVAGRLTFIEFSRALTLVLEHLLKLFEDETEKPVFSEVFARAEFKLFFPMFFEGLLVDSKASLLLR